MGIKETHANDYANSLMADKAAKAREIGSLAEIENPERRQRCAKNLTLFAETYFPHLIKKNFSPDHKKVIKAAERTILQKMYFAFTMPRGTGKTTLMKIFVLWAILYGYAKLVVVVAGNAHMASRFIASLLFYVTKNERLIADFPELKCFRELKGEPRKQGGQTVDGEKTEVFISADKLRFPTFAGIASSAAEVSATSITSQFRGLNSETMEGSNRPDLVVLDDIQSDQSAMSPEQISKFLTFIFKGICGLSGPGERMAMFFIATVISKGDVCDTLLDREKYPDWQGEKCKLLYAWPERMDLWENQYCELRVRSLREKGNISLATKFYRENKKEMSKGAVVAWKERYTKGYDADALQHAMELYFVLGRFAFASEFQNEPLVEERGVGRIEIPLSNLSNLNRYTVPNWATHLVVGIDVGAYCASYVLLACRYDLRCSVVSWGTWPEQPSEDFSYSKNMLTWGDDGNHPKNVRAGLVAMFRYFETRWVKEDKTKIPLSGGLVDMGYLGDEAVIPAICEAGMMNRIIPAKGYGTSASNKQIAEWTPARNEVIRDHMRIRQDAQRGQSVLMDANAWKTTLSHMADIPAGEPGSITLWGSDPMQHTMFYRHLESEFPVETTALGRTINEWKHPGRDDNHLLDAFVYALGAAAMTGCRLIQRAPVAAPVADPSPIEFNL